MYYVYFIKSLKRNWFYIGYTYNLKERIEQHNKGQVQSTGAYMPFVLVYYEVYADKTLARKRELELKNNSQQKEILFKRLAIIK